MLQSIQWRLKSVLVIALTAITSITTAQTPQNACIENGGAMECKLAIIKSEKRLLCNEYGPYMWIDNITNRCGWGNIQSDSDIADKAECFSDAVAGCAGTAVDPVVWSSPGDVYRSDMCWTMHDRLSGNTRTKFAVVTGRSIYRNAEQGNACINHGSLPQPLVARNDIVYGCDPGWNLYQRAETGEAECRRSAPVEISIEGPSSTQALPAFEGPIDLIISLSRNGSPVRNTALRGTMKEQGTQVSQEFSGITDDFGNYQLRYVPPYMKSTTVDITTNCDQCQKPADKTVDVFYFEEDSDMCRR